MKHIFAISILLMSAMTLPVYGTASIVAGNWYLQASSQLSATGASQIPQIGGSLMQNGSIVSGVLHISDSDCYDWATGLPVSGTINGTTVSLTSHGVAGEAITINGTVTSNLITGTYNIQAGCADGDYGTITATLLSPATGNWTGTVAGGANAAAMLSQALPNASGYSLLSGTLTFSGANCTASGTLANDQSWVLGNVIQAVVSLNNGGVMALNGFITDVSNAANRMTVNFSISEGTCAGQTGSVTFSRP